MTEPASTSGPPSDTGGASRLAGPDSGSLAIRGGGLRVAGYGVGLLFSLVALSLLTRHLGVVEFGRYVTVLSLIAVVALVTDAGLVAVGVREYAVRDGEGRQRLMRSLLGLRMALTCVGVLGAVVFATVAGYDSTLVLGTLIAGGGLLLVTLQHTYAVPLSAELRLGSVTALDLLRQALTAVFIVALVAAGSGLLSFLAVAIPVGLAVAALAVVSVRGISPTLPSFERKEWHLLLRETLPVAAATSIGSVYYRIAIILMSLISADEETGYFSASLRIIEALIMVPAIVAAAVFPVVAHAAAHDRERFRYLLNRIFEVSVIVGAWLALCVALGAELAIGALAGDGFEPSVVVLRIQAPALAATFLVAVGSIALLGLRDQRALVIANSVGVAAATALVLLLVPGGGARGAAVAMTGAEVTLAVAYAVLLLRGRPELRPSLRVLPLVAVATVAAVASALIPVSDIPSLMIATVLYFGVLFAAGAIPTEVTDAMCRRRRTSPANR